MADLLCDMATEFSDGIYWHRCRRCGNYRVSVTERYYEPCGVVPPVQEGLCAYLGPSLRRVACSTCRSRGWSVKVLACAIHGECTVELQLPGVACCRGCGQYSRRA